MHVLAWCFFKMCSIDATSHSLAKVATFYNNRMHVPDHIQALVAPHVEEDDIRARVAAYSDAQCQEAFGLLNELGSAWVQGAHATGGDARTRNRIVFALSVLERQPDMLPDYAKNLYPSSLLPDEQFSLVRNALTSPNPTPTSARAFARWLPWEVWMDADTRALSSCLQELTPLEQLSWIPLHDTKANLAATFLNMSTWSGVVPGLIQKTVKVDSAHNETLLAKVLPLLHGRLSLVLGENQWTTSTLTEWTQQLNALDTEPMLTFTPPSSD